MLLSTLSVKDKSRYCVFVLAICPYGFPTIALYYTILLSFYQRINFQVNNYQAIIVSGVVRAYAVFSYICGEMQWSSVGANDLAVVGFNAAGPFNGVNDELSFKNYRLSGLPNVGVTISCEYEPVTNLIIRLPSTEAQRRKLECIQQLKRDMDILQGETTYTELADMLTQCPCSRDQCLQDEARFIRQESITDRECYITTNPIEMQIGEQYLTITQQCCYTSNR